LLPRVVKGDQDFELDHDTFRARFFERFNDPMYESISAELEKVFDVTWQPRKIEITGQFFGRRSAKQSERTPLISLKKGIHWNGGGVLPGTVDLRLQGKGKIDFQRSGLIQVLPY